MIRAVSGDSLTNLGKSSKSAVKLKLISIKIHENNDDERRFPTEARRTSGIKVIITEAIAPPPPVALLDVDQ